jgi:protein-S-isoprenylcysteine O-methyltransferase Ste14
MSRGFDIFQLAVLACFLCVFLGRTLALRLRHGVKVFTLGVGKSRGRAALELLLVVGLPLWLYEIVAYAWPLPFHVLPPPLDAVVLDAPAARLLGALLVSGGLLVFALALGAFGKSWRVGIDERSPGELVTGGIFAVTRNPIFLFLDLYFVGTFLLSGRLVFLLAAIVAVVAIHLQIRQEERFLERTYGDAYRAYCDGVARYLIW